jgi:hypothetical protein
MSAEPEIHLATDCPRQEDGFWAVSLCFWACLFLSATVYAAVALAPKFCVWNAVRLENQQATTELVRLEADVAYLERVEAALQTDHEFRQRVAGIAVPANGHEELIPVSGSLLFGHELPPATQASAPVMPAYHAMALQLARHRTLRWTMLTFASTLTLFAFAFLNDAGVNLVHASARITRTILMAPIRRYIATPVPQQTTDLPDSISQPEQ